ncbi:transcriptional regulatory [Trichoderma arundinaceum]|uniref:Transcriptional regulatory n=1 Tax=Trichoderma arundinaceum TaxID=490622 RepID=A0A395N9P9_TRIAR|nr:transcriptional regulatory [Trichoderma arundinaceum]
MSDAMENVGSPRNGLACQNCRQRKRKCDRQVPRCGLCVRRGLECVMQVTKSTDGQEGAIQSLEKEISSLEAQLSRLQTTAAEFHHVPAALQPHVDPTLTPFEASVSSAASREQSMDTVDLDVLKEVETVSLYRGELYSLQKMTRRALRLENCDPRGLLNLTPKKSLLASSESSKYSRSIGYSEPLDYDLALTYADKYFSYIHPTFPIISEDLVRSALNRVATGSQNDLGERAISYLVISIGALLPIESSAAFDTRNSADYFIRALELHYSYDESDTTARILLLLTIYSLFDPSTGSSWHLIDLATQACIVMGYHQLQSELVAVGEEDQDGVKLFQAVYILDL